MKNLLMFIVLAGLVGGGVYWYITKPKDTPVAQVSYACADALSLTASYYEGKKVETAPGEMPVPTGRVELVLSDGRRLSLPRTLSASGIRYANQTESLVFWSKGTTAFLMENNDQTYADCVEQK